MYNLLVMSGVKNIEKYIEYADPRCNKVVKIILKISNTKYIERLMFDLYC